MIWTKRLPESNWDHISCQKKFSSKGLNTIDFQQSETTLYSFSDILSAPLPPSFSYFISLLDISQTPLWSSIQFSPSSITPSPTNLPPHPTPPQTPTLSVSLSFFSVHCCRELHTISASMCCCPRNRETKNRPIFFTPDISAEQSDCFYWQYTFSHLFCWPLSWICMCTCWDAALTNSFARGRHMVDAWQVTSPVQNCNLVFNVVLFPFQGFLRDALDGH